MSGVTNTEIAVERFEVLLREQKKLARELTRSLCIEEIWPEAFQDGSCKTRIRKGYWGYVSACLVAGNGVEYSLTKAEVLRLYPEARFSKKWEEPSRN